MQRIQDRDTRYFLTIDRKTLNVVGHDYEQKQYLNKGKQPSADSHRLFIIKGQYDRFVARCIDQRE